MHIFKSKEAGAVFSTLFSLFGYPDETHEKIMIVLLNVFEGTKIISKPPKGKIKDFSSLTRVNI